jgi:hypothetical protein
MSIGIAMTMMVPNQLKLTLDNGCFFELIARCAKYVGSMFRLK